MDNKHDLRSRSESWRSGPQIYNKSEYKLRGNYRAADLSSANYNLPKCKNYR